MVARCDRRTGYACPVRSVENGSGDALNGCFWPVAALRKVTTKHERLLEEAADDQKGHLAADQHHSTSHRANAPSAKESVSAVSAHSAPNAARYQKISASTGQAS